MDFTAAAHFTGLFARKLLDASPERDVDAIKVDVPRGAKAETPWRLTRLSRARYYQPQRPEREALSVPAQIPYRISFDPCEAEPDSDVYALRVERKVTVTPLSLDLTSRTDLPALERILRGGG
jgi:5'-nucleotidase